jgi:hypothetical protein
MRTLRVTLDRWTVAAILVWSLINLYVQTFKGASVGGPACYTDPTCGEIAWIPTAAWIGGILIILVMGFLVNSARHDRRKWAEPPIPIVDRLTAVVVVLAMLAFAALVFWYYQATRVVA